MFYYEKLCILFINYQSRIGINYHWTLFIGVLVVLGAELVETSAAPLGHELVHSRKATKTATAYDIVELAEVVRRGDEGVHSAACNKLSVIADQIRYLQEQAKQV